MSLSVSVSRLCKGNENLYSDFICTYFIHTCFNIKNNGNGIKYYNKVCKMYICTYVCKIYICIKKIIMFLIYNKRKVKHVFHTSYIYSYINRQTQIHYQFSNLNYFSILYYDPFIMLV